ncbi:MAG: hypothetical protein E6K87_07410 [Thaumarchaeota archaeon]|nr:MAG: hypothetical protein E6K87_07410 [Nitrososphaerota archaeon]
MAQRAISEQSQPFLEDIDFEGNPELVIGMIESLQDFEIEEYQRLNAIKKALQSGKPVPKYKISGLDATYLRLQRESEHQGKIQWTLDIIESFLKVKIGDPKRLHILKSRLEEGREVDEKEISYLRENYKLLRKAIQQRNKMLEDIIKKL